MVTTAASIFTKTAEGKNTKNILLLRSKELDKGLHLKPCELWASSLSAAFLNIWRRPKNKQSAACNSLLVEDLKIVTSVEGISNGTGTTFLAELGNIKNFENHKKLIAYADIDPTVYQSGKYQGTSKISKRGNKHLRRVLWLMTVNVIHHNNIFKDYYQKKKQAGLPYKKAVLATMHKLTRMLFAMLSNKQQYAKSMES